MLTANQTQYLSSIAGITVRAIGTEPVSIISAPETKVKVPLGAFKAGMNLSDPRFEWLLGSKNMMCGGSILSWLTGANNHNDYDFFFSDNVAAGDFVRFIQTYGFVVVRTSNYAATYFNEQDGTIIQAVGAGYSEFVANERGFYGAPHEVIDRFDFGIAKFAIDADYLYTTTHAVRDLLGMSIRIYNASNLTVERLLKYMKKGYYFSTDMVQYNDKHKPIIEHLSTW